MKLLLVWVSFIFMATRSHAVLPSMDVWPYASRPFNVSVRWQHCLSSRVELAANETVADYGALLSAELGRLSVLGGGAVRLLDGTYPVKSPIIFGNNTCLLGESLNGVVLEVANDAPESPASRGVLHGINVLNVTVRDLTVDANKHGQEDDDKGNYKCENELTKYGTYFEASSYLWFTNTRVINACAYGYDFSGNNSTFSHNVVLENSTADSSGKDGVKLFRMVNTSLLGVLTLNNGRHGLHIAGSQNILLARNTFAADGQKESYEGCGIRITDRYGLWSDGVIARYTRVHDFYRAGFCLGRARWVGLIDSTITNMRREEAQCYEMDGAEDVMIIRGTCSTLNGISEGEDLYAEESPEPTACAANEIEQAGVCCPEICGACGGDGCSERLPYKACCVDDIRAAGNKCGVDGPAPCNL